MKQITATQFNKLSLSQKAEIVFGQTKHIGSRQYYNQRLVLYNLDDLFIEVWYEPISNKISKIELLDDINKLDLYISQNL